MDINLTTPALLFPAMSLIMLAYTNRFLGLATVIRNLCDRCQKLAVKVTRPDGSRFTFDAVSRLDTPVEVHYFKNGGILPAVLRGMVK